MNAHGAQYYSLLLGQAIIQITTIECRRSLLYFLDGDIVWFTGPLKFSGEVTASVVSKV
jgi:hypothetical protein